MDAEVFRRPKRYHTSWRMQVQASAWHEAGHAVVNQIFGGEIGYAGITVRRHPLTHNRRQVFIKDFASMNRVKVEDALIGLAGWAAEHHWHGRGPTRMGDDDLDCMEGEIWTVWGDGEWEHDDTYSLLRLLQTRRPREPWPAIMAAYRVYEDRARQLVALPWTWSIITALAKPLYQRGSLSDEEAMDLIDRAEERLDSGDQTPGV